MPKNNRIGIEENYTIGFVRLFSPAAGFFLSLLSFLRTIAPPIYILRWDLEYLSSSPMINVTCSSSG
jgi:hypothetical protein